MIRRDETICAPATQTGGAIALIRISGPESIRICNTLFFAASGMVRLEDIEANRQVHGAIKDGSEVIDDVLVTIFRAPRSYTGEDSVEISCHGSSFIQKKILELLIMGGCSAAQPGEFTRRAFLNGKMDLSQAEAVADLVASSTRSAHRIAINQMRGGVSEEIGQLRAELLHFASMIELELDFGEEDVEFADRSELVRIINKIKAITEKLATSFELGNAIKNGIPVAIVGKPNSGKSTLLNALLMEEKAIVSDIPGTTRDVVEDTIVIDGIEFRFIDTAGLRETTDIIESIGIKKTLEKIAQASVILLVDEVTDHPGQINKRAENLRKMISGSEKKIVIVVNKADLSGPAEHEQLRKKVTLRAGESLLFISAMAKQGLELLRQVLSEFVEMERLSSDQVIITNLRHFESLKRVSESLVRVESALITGLPEDLIATDVRQAIHYLGEITGEITTDEILGNIFKNFCIGK